MRPQGAMWLLAEVLEEGEARSSICRGQADSFPRPGGDNSGWGQGQALRRAPVHSYQLGSLLRRAYGVPYGHPDGFSWRTGTHMHMNISCECARQLYSDSWTRQSPDGLQL